MNFDLVMSYVLLGFGALLAIALVASFFQRNPSKEGRWTLLPKKPIFNADNSFHKQNFKWNLAMVLAIGVIVLLLDRCGVLPL